MDVERFRVAGMDSKYLRHAAVWAILDELAERGGLDVREYGRSALGLPLRSITAGSGPTSVLVFSQVHGNEPAGTMALADVISFLVSGEPDAARILDAMTVTLAPMVNPDGAERFTRHNALGIDCNRDMRTINAPETRALLELYGVVQPLFSLSLHEQEPRKRVATSRVPVAYSICSPHPDGAAKSDRRETRSRAKRVLAHVRQAIEPLVPGQLTRYGAPFNAQTICDNFESWGTSVLLFEAGWWRDDADKQYLRRVHGAAVVAALDGIARGVFETGSPDAFDTLPETGGEALVDLLFRGATIAAPGLPPFRSDVSVNFDLPLERSGPRLIELGDLEDVDGIEEHDARDLVLHLAPAMLKDGAITLESEARIAVKRSDGELVLRLGEH